MINWQINGLGVSEFPSGYDSYYYFKTIQLLTEDQKVVTEVRKRRENAIML